MEGLPIFDIPWLIPGLLALAVLLLGLAFYGWRRSKQIAAEIMRMEARKMSPEDELKTLGIVAVRQLDEQLERSSSEAAREEPSEDFVQPPFRSEEPSQASSQSAAILEELVEEDRRNDGTEDVPRFAPSRTSLSVDNAESVSVGRHPGTYLNQASPLWMSSDGDADAVAFLLESLWAALHAQSIALLRFDKKTSSYCVDALVSERVTQQISLFPADGNVLNNVLDDTSISVLEPDAFNALRYHSDPMTAVGHAMAIAVNDRVDGVLLVADVERGAKPFGKQRLERFGDYADLLTVLLPEGEKATTEKKTKSEPAANIAQPSDSDYDGERTSDEPAADVVDGDRPEGTEPDHTFVFDELAAEESKPDIKKPTFDLPQKRNGSHRPRNEIVADEMAAARQVQEPLALALVVPRNGEEISARGPRAVAEAEEELMARLQNVAGSARVERFGELVMGVFSKAGPAFVEAWVERVEASEGLDVQIGVALLRARHRTPESFRADAETALHEAYTRKEDCVIVD